MSHTDAEPQTPLAVFSLSHHHTCTSNSARSIVRAFLCGTGERLGVILFVGTVTACYTAAGGLFVSILTDQGQVGNQGQPEALADISSRHISQPIPPIHQSYYEP